MKTFRRSWQPIETSVRNRFPEFMTHDRPTHLSVVEQVELVVDSA